MIQFYEAYKDDEFVTTLLSKVSWSNHIEIFNKAKTLEERHFYINLCIKEGYSAREIQRQIDSAYYERYLLSKDKLPAEIKHAPDDVPFMDTYVFDFLNLPKKFYEHDLRDAIIERMKDFILEVGKDFYIDLLFFHRGLKCLTATPPTPSSAWPATSRMTTNLKGSKRPSQAECTGKYQVFVLFPPSSAERLCRGLLSHRCKTNQPMEI